MEEILNLIRTPYKYGHLVIPPSYEIGKFDSHLTDCPFPFFHDGRFYLTYAGWDGTGYRTGLAVSDDLIHWKKLGLIAGRGPVGSFTEHNVAITNILRDNELYGPGTLKKINGTFAGSYHAYPNAGYEEGAASVGLCYSEDLLHWRFDDSVLRPEDGEGWEHGGLYKSWLMEHDGTFYLFYNAKNKTYGDWQEQTGVAVSHDLKSWERYSGNPILKIGKGGAFDGRFASDPAVFRVNGTWVMFYFGASYDGHARDGAAVSSDLLHWEKTGDILINTGKPNEIDSLYAHKPGIIAKDGILYHFYCAVRPAQPGETGIVSHDEIRGITFAASKSVL